MNIQTRDLDTRRQSTLISIYEGTPAFTKKKPLGSDIEVNPELQDKSYHNSSLSRILFQNEALFETPIVCEVNGCTNLA